MGDKKKEWDRKFFGIDLSVEKSIDYFDLAGPRSDDKKDLYLFVLFNLLGVLYIGILIYSVGGNKTIGMFDSLDLFLTTGIMLWGTNLIREFRYKHKIRRIVSVFAITAVFVGYLTVRGILYF